jgi:hypothetical protein
LLKWFNYSFVFNCVVGRVHSFLHRTPYFPDLAL